MAAQYKAQYKACISDMSSRLAYARRSVRRDSLYGNAIRIPATVVFFAFSLGVKMQKGKAREDYAIRENFMTTGL